MYIPPYFEESRVDVLQDMIGEFPLGTLVSHGGKGLDANHLPFELETASGRLGRLQTHLARRNPLWQELTDGDDVLVIFHCGNAYISPSWYPSKHETHEEVPTWNYRVVHAHGKVAIRDDERYVHGVVARLTRKLEASQSNPWKMGQLKPEARAEMLKEVVGLEIEIVSLVGKFKLGQNKQERDRRGAAEALISQGDRLIGEAMCDAHASEQES